MQIKIKTAVLQVCYRYITIDRTPGFSPPHFSSLSTRPHGKLPHRRLFLSPLIYNPLIVISDAHARDLAAYYYYYYYY